MKWAIQLLLACTLLLGAVGRVEAVPFTITPTDAKTVIDSPPFGSPNSGDDLFALTSPGSFVDAVLVTFGLGANASSVDSATLSFNTAVLYGTDPGLQVTAFADDGSLSVSDYQFFPTPATTLTVTSTGATSLDVTSILNSVLQGQTIGLQSQSSASPTSGSGFQGIEITPNSIELEVDTPAIPEPTSLVLLGLVGVGLMATRRRRWAT
jgi:hypothetical protein